MRRHALFLALLLVPLVAAGQGEKHVKSFEFVEVNTHVKTGQLITVTETGGGDTLQVWLRHAENKLDNLKTPHNGAAQADIVVRCYPKLHPHPNHIFPNSEGEVYMVRRNKTLFFFDEVGAEQAYFDLNVVAPI